MKCFLATEIAALVGNVAGITTEAGLLGVAQSLVARAAELGLVLTIEQQPLKPLAMGHFETTVSVRAARTIA